MPLPSAFAGSPALSGQRPGSLGHHLAPRWSVLCSPLSCPCTITPGPLCVLLSVYSNLTMPPFALWAASDSVSWLGLISLCPGTGGPSQDQGHLSYPIRALLGLTQKHLLSSLKSPYQSLSSGRAGTAPVLLPLCPQPLLCGGDSYKAQLSKRRFLFH